MAAHKGKQYGWFMSAVFMLYGFIRLMKFMIVARYYYPHLSKNHHMDKMKSEASKGLKVERITPWQFFKNNIFDKQTLIHLAFGRNFARIHFLPVGSQAPSGRFFTLDAHEMNLQKIMSQSAKKIHVLNFGSYT